MKQELHPLQIQAQSLISSLYADIRLPPRAAVVAYGNGRYPSLVEILDTFEAYKDTPSVKAYLIENGDLIASAKCAIEELKKPKKAKSEDDVESFEDILKHKPDFVDPFKSFKSVSMHDIETAFSEALSKICKEHLIVNITAVNTPNSKLELAINVKAKSLISTWKDDAIENAKSSHQNS